MKIQYDGLARPKPSNLYFGDITIQYVFIAVLVWCITTLTQLQWYLSSLGKEDDSYMPLFPKSINENGEIGQSV